MGTRSFLWPVLILSFSLRCAGPAEQQGREWRYYGADPAGTKYSALDQINRSNVKQLQLAWQFHSGDELGRASTIECNPIVVDGVIYLTTPSLKLVALEAARGTRLWTFDPWQGRPAQGVNRGVTYWQEGEERRIFHVGGPFLYALDPATGVPIPGFGKEGRIDLREGLDRDVSGLSVTSNTPGIVYRDLLILGSAVGEGPAPSAPGHIRAFDVRTGARRWIFHTIPHPGEKGYDTWPADAWKRVGGANSWGGCTLDEARGLVFCGTGSASYDHFGGDRIGQNLFANCILALEAASGKLAWYFQTVHHDIWDYDIPCPPNLVQVKRGDRLIDAVAQATKVGHLFVLDRQTGEPLFPVEERPVPQTDLPGEETWPTQPFPLKPPPYAKQRFTLEDVTEVSPQARAHILAQLEGMRLGDVYLPPGLSPSITLPQFNGGTDWGGAAYDPATRILFVNASDEPEWISMVLSDPRERLRLDRLGERLYGAMCTSCHAGQAPPGQPQGASLARLEERLTRKEVLTILESGRGQMPSFGHLSGTERRALTAYLFGDRPDEMVDAGPSEWARYLPYIATGHRELRDPNGLPASKPPWGTVSAISLDEGEILWQVPLGTYPQLEAQGHPPTGTFNMGGPVVTAGGLLFIGAAMDERFRALDKDTGKLLWEFQLDAGGYATPATFAVDGKQYVVIAAGGGGKPGTKPGDSYYCFSLP